MEKRNDLEHFLAEFSSATSRDFPLYIFSIIKLEKTYLSRAKLVRSRKASKYAFRKTNLYKPIHPVLNIERANAWKKFVY